MRVKMSEYFRSTLRSILFSEPARTLLHAVLSTKIADRLRSKIEKRGHYGLLAVLSTAKAPSGYVYVSSISAIDHYWHRSLTICANDDQLFTRTVPKQQNQASSPPFLNRLAPTSHRHERHHSQSEPQDHSVSRFQHTSKPQRVYDDLHGVRCRRGIFFSLRGNIESPGSIIVTFAQAPDIESAVHYPVMHLESISDIELTESLIIAIQPRVRGLPIDSDPRSLDWSASLLSLIRRKLSRAALDDSDLTFILEPRSTVDINSLLAEFPRANTIALRYIQRDPARISSEGSIECPPTAANLDIDRTEQFVRSTRPQDYILYSDTGGLTNPPPATLSAEAPRDRLFVRFSVDPDQLSVAATPTLLAIVRFLLGGSQILEGEPVSELRTYRSQVGTGIQIRVDSDQPSGEDAHWFLAFRGSDHFILTDMTDHRLPFVKYTNQSQYISQHVLDHYRLTGALSIGLSTGPMNHRVRLR